jgi:hypothetical protein
MIWLVLIPPLIPHFLCARKTGDQSAENPEGVRVRKIKYGDPFRVTRAWFRPRCADARPAAGERLWSLRFPAFPEDV